MLKWFQCPDTKLVEVKSCLKECRLGHRCMTLPTLSSISEEREWSGEPSTTQLLNGTMYEFLKLTKDFSVDPQDRAFALLGTIHHSRMEDRARQLGLPTELAMNVDRDILDLLEPIPNGWLLTDYKTWGSYRVASAIGIVSAGKVPDQTGATYMKSGAWGKAGSPKMVNNFIVDKSQADMWETEMQLNRYRLMLANRGLAVTDMQVQITVRDGGIAMARDRGVVRNIYLEPVRFLDSEMVQSYFGKKRSDLLTALDKCSWSEVCNPKECWDDARCKGYCEVALYCPKGLILRTGG